ncbi:MAG: glycerol kinase GlpK [Clostridia bacterium]|nr:glycerol kinase GlpK [Clostridia bacterium]
MKKYVLAIDEGTTSCRTIIFDYDCAAVSMGQYELKQFYPHPAWVEEDPEEIIDKQMKSINKAISSGGVDPSEIAAIGITNQRETTVVWNKNTGKAVCNAIVWQCRRTAPICEIIEKQGYAPYITEATGLKLDAYFSATKIKWILDNVSGAREEAELGNLLFGTVDTWLIWNLTGGKVHATDMTNASRTMIYNINTLDWDDRLLKIFGIPRSMLPEVKPSGSIYGYANIGDCEIPISGVAGDQQAALFGQCCWNPGEMKNTYGTGCFLLVNVGNTPVRSNNGLVTTVAATIGDEKPEYALEGSVFIGGAIVKWLRDRLGLIKTAAETEVLAKQAGSSKGAYIVPAFAGLGAPYWDMDARGSFFGITGATGRAEIVRAALESIAYQTNDLVLSITADMGSKPLTLKVDGGAAANSFLLQFQADISNVKVAKPANNEATATGAAFLAGLTAGFWKTRRDVAVRIATEKEFIPDIDEGERERRIRGWKTAVEACRQYK